MAYAYTNATTRLYSYISSSSAVLACARHNSKHINQQHQPSSRCTVADTAFDSCRHQVSRPERANGTENLLIRVQTIDHSACHTAGYFFADCATNTKAVQASSASYRGLHLILPRPCCERRASILRSPLFVLLYQLGCLLVPLFLAGSRRLITLSGSLLCLQQPTQVQHNGHHG